MAITLNPSGLVITGLGVATISYINGGAVTQTAVTGTGVICIGAEISPFADQSPVTANGTIIGFMAKNSGTRYSYKCYIIGAGTAIVAAPPNINTMIQFDFHANSVTDIAGVVKSSKVTISDDIAILDVEMDVVAGLTASSTPPLIAGP